MARKWMLLFVVCGFCLTADRAWGQTFEDVGAGLVAGTQNEVDAQGRELYLMADDAQTPPATGDLTVNGDQTILMDNGALYVNDFVVNAGVGAPGTPSLLYSETDAGSLPVTPTGQLTANTFTIEEGAYVSGAAGVDTTVNGIATFNGQYTAAGANLFKGAATIGQAGEYVASGTDSIFEAGLTVQGTLTKGAGVATVQLGTDTVDARLDLDGGRIDSDADGLFLATDANSTSQGLITVGPNFASFSGQVHAEANGTSNGFAMEVAGNLALDGDNTDLYVNTYSQSWGWTFTGNVDNALHVTDTDSVAEISGASTVFSIGATFAGGARFSDGAWLSGIGQTINGGTNTALTMESSTIVDLSNGGLTMNGFDSVNLFGKGRFGFDDDNDQSYFLDATGSTGVHYGAETDISFTDSFTRGYYNRGTFTTTGAPTDWLVKGNFVDSYAGTSTHYGDFSNIFGDYHLGYRANDVDGGLWLDGYSKSSVDDYGAVGRQLGKIWGGKQISGGFAASVAEVGKNILDSDTGAVPVAGSDAGAVNYAILGAFARNDSGYSAIGRDYGTVYTGSVDSGLLAAFNGHIGYGPNTISMSMATEVMNTIGSRQDSTRNLQAAIRSSIGSDDAMAATILNQNCLNRIWAGGLGLWQDADSRGGFAGYKYDAGGVILGYDRAFGPIVAGAAFSYVKGDYEDKSASSHDSTIKHYAFDLYATYSASKGYFASLIAGYTYSDNDIKERRGGAWGREDYHTNTWHLGLKAGYDWRPNDCFTLSPSVGLSYLHASNSSHSFRLHGLSLLDYGRMKNHTVQLPLEVNAKYDIGINADAKFTLGANAGYTYNFRDNAIDGTVGINGMTGVFPIDAVSRKTGRHTWNIGGGVKYSYRKFEVGVDYNYYSKASYDAHRVMGSVGYSF